MKAPYHNSVLKLDGEKKKRRDSDGKTVQPVEEKIDWDLTLTGFDSGDRQRTIRFLSGAIIGCGGWVLSRSLDASDSAEITFEFARVISVEIYSVLIAAGLELSRDAHLSMTELCQCTKALIDICAYDIARIRLLVLPKVVQPERKKRETTKTAKNPGS